MLLFHNLGEIEIVNFHKFIRFLNAVNTLHCLISLSSVFLKTGDNYDRLFFPWRIVLKPGTKSQA